MGLMSYEENQTNEIIVLAQVISCITEESGLFLATNINEHFVF